MPSVFITSTVRIRDDGQELRSSDGKEVVREANPNLAWDPDSYVHIRSRLKSGDLETGQQLQFGTPSMRASANNPDDAQVETKVGVHLPTLIYPALLVDHFEGEFFNDPRTGKPMEVPAEADITARLDLMREMPFAVVSFVNHQILDRAANPFGTTQKSEPPLSDGSGTSLTTQKAGKSSPRTKTTSAAG